MTPHHPGGGRAETHQLEVRPSAHLTLVQVDSPRSQRSLRRRLPSFRHGGLSESVVLLVTSSVGRGVLGLEDGVGIFRRSGHPVRLLGVAVAVFVVLVVAGVVLRPGQDLGLARALNGLHTGVVGAVSSAVYKVFEPLPSVVYTVVLAVVVWVVKDLRSGVAFAGVVALTWIPTEVIKVVVHRGRPDVLVMRYPYLPVQTDASFPSGHTAFIVALVVALVFVVGGTRWRPVVVGVGSVVVAVVAVALAVDAVHFPSDIAASVLWSLAVAPAARLVWVDWVMPRVPFLAVPAPRPAPSRAVPAATSDPQDGAPAAPTSEPSGR